MPFTFRASIDEENLTGTMRKKLYIQVDAVMLEVSEALKPDDLHQAMCEEAELLSQTRNRLKNNRAKK